MRILLINPPHPSIGSRIPREQLPPLGLLSIGGPLIDAGHDVALLDAEFGPMRIEDIVAQAVARAPDALLLGHSGSTSGHPIVCELTCALRAVLPDAWIIYGGVFPTYHWREILVEEPQIDVIVRGEGEETTPHLMAGAGRRPSIARTSAASRSATKGVVVGTPPGPDDRRPRRLPGRLGADRSRALQLLGRQARRGRAVLARLPAPVQLLRPARLLDALRHRDPKKFAAEIARLHRQHGVEVFNFADENPSASRKHCRLARPCQSQLALIGRDTCRAASCVGSTHGRIDASCSTPYPASLRAAPLRLTHALLNREAMPVCLAAASRSTADRKGVRSLWLARQDPTATLLHGPAPMRPGSGPAFYECRPFSLSCRMARPIRSCDPIDPGLWHATSAGDAPRAASAGW